MSLFEVFVPARDAHSVNVTLRLEASNWMGALRQGLAQLGEGNEAIANIVCDIKGDGVVHVTDNNTLRVFRIRDLGAAAPVVSAAPVEPAVSTTNASEETQAQTPAPAASLPTYAADTIVDLPAIKIDDAIAAQQKSKDKHQEANEKNNDKNSEQNAKTAVDLPAVDIQGESRRRAPAPVTMALPTLQMPQVDVTNEKSARDLLTSEDLLPAPDAPNPTYLPSIAVASSVGALSLEKSSEKSVEKVAEKLVEKPVDKTEKSEKSGKNDKNDKNNNKKNQKNDKKEDKKDDKSTDKSVSKKPESAQKTEIALPIVTPAAVAPTAPVAANVMPAPDAPAPAQPTVDKVAEKAGEKPADKPVAATSNKPVDKAAPNKTSSSIDERLFDAFEATQALFANTTLSVGDATQKMIDIAMAQIPSEAGTFYMADVNNTHLAFSAVRGPRTKKIADTGVQIHIGDGIAGLCAQSGLSLLSNDVANDPRHEKNVAMTVEYQPKNTVCAAVCDPEGRLWGVMQLFDSKKNNYDDNDVEVLRTLAQSAAQLLRNLAGAGPIEVAQPQSFLRSALRLFKR